MEKDKNMKKIRIMLKIALLCYMFGSVLGLTGCYGESWTSCSSSSTESGGSGNQSENGGKINGSFPDWSLEVTAPTQNQEVVVEEGDSVTISVQVSKDSDPYMADWYCNGVELDYVMKSIDGKSNLNYTIQNVTANMDGWEYYLHFTPDSKLDLGNKNHFVTSPIFRLKVVSAGQAPKWYGGSSFDYNNSHEDTFIKISRLSSIKGWEGEDITSSLFQNDDQISVWAWTGDSTKVPEKFVVNGSVNTFNNNNWKSTPQMLWADMTSDHYFLAIQNQTKDTGSITDFTADPYVLPVNEETGLVDNQQADVLVATRTEGIKATDTPIELVFKHILAKLVVNLDLSGFGFEIPEEAETNVTLVEAYTEGTIDYLAGTVTPNEEAVSNITLAQQEGANEGFDQTFSSIAIPGTEVNMLQVTIGGVEYSYTNDVPVTLTGGEATTINLNSDNLIGPETPTPSLSENNDIEDKEPEQSQEPVAASVEDSEQSTEETSPVPVEESEKNVEQITE